MPGPRRFAILPKGGLLSSLAKENLPTDEEIERMRRDKVPVPPGYGATGDLLKMLARLIEPTAEDQLFSLGGPLAMPAATLQKLGMAGKKLYHGTSKEGYDLLKPNRGAAFTTPDKDLASSFAGSGYYNPPRILPFKGRPEANLFDFRDPKEVDKVMGLIKENDLPLAGIRKGDPRAEWAAERIDRIREDLKDGHWTTMEKYQKEIKAAGFDGYLEKETRHAEGPTSYAFFDPDKDLGHGFVGPPRDVDNPIFPHGREDWSGETVGPPAPAGATPTPKVTVNKDYGKPLGPPPPEVVKASLAQSPLEQANTDYLNTAMNDAVMGDHDLKLLLTQANVQGLTDAQQAYAVSVYKQNKANGFYTNKITNLDDRDQQHALSKIFAHVKDEVDDSFGMGDLDHNKLWW